MATPDDRSKIEVMIVRIECVTNKGTVLEGSPLAHVPPKGTVSECFRYMGDRFHQMAREDEEITRQLNQASDEAIKKLQDAAWGKVGKA